MACRGPLGRQRRRRDRRRARQALRGVVGGYRTRMPKGGCGRPDRRAEGALARAGSTGCARAFETRAVQRAVTVLCRLATASRSPVLNRAERTSGRLRLGVLRCPTSARQSRSGRRDLLGEHTSGQGILPSALIFPVDDSPERLSRRCASGCAPRSRSARLFPERGWCRWPGPRVDSAALWPGQLGPAGSVEGAR